MQSKLDAGDKLIGVKLGLTSWAKQEAMGVTEPLYGWITSSMIAGAGQPARPAKPDPAARSRRSPSCWAATSPRPRPSPACWLPPEAVFAAVDILDSRYRDYRFTLPDVIADNASAGRVVLASRPADLVDLRLVGCLLRAGGTVAATAARAVMGHPAVAVAWLANCLGSRGERLRAGWLVLSGGLTAPVPLEPGQAVTAELDGLGSVEVYPR